MKQKESFEDLDKRENMSTDKSGQTFIVDKCTKYETFSLNDNQPRCPSTSSSSCNSHKGNFTITKDSYHTHIDGGIHGPMFFGPHFSNCPEEDPGFDDTSTENKTKQNCKNKYHERYSSYYPDKLELKDEYNIVIDTTTAAIPPSAIKI